MKCLTLFSILALLFSVSLFSNPINYQGILLDSDGNSVENSIYSATFSLYDSENVGNNLWQEEQSFITNNGIFNIQLGSFTPFGNLDFSQSLWLEIHIEGEASPLTDRIRLGSVPTSKSTSNLSGGKIENAEIGSQTPSSATFTYLEITDNLIEASSATLNLETANFASSTLYIPNSIADGAILTSDGNGNATWQENNASGGSNNSNTFYEYIRHYTQGLNIPDNSEVTVGLNSLSTIGFDNRFRLYQSHDSEVKSISFYTDANAGSTTFRIYKNGNTSSDIIDYNEQTQDANTQIVYSFSSATFNAGDYYYITFQSANLSNLDDWNVVAAVKVTP